LALVVAFVGFGAACFGIAWLVAGIGGALHVVLAVVGSIAFIACAFSYVPLASRDYARDEARRVSQVAAHATPLVPGSTFDTGHVWYINAMRIVLPCMVWFVGLAVMFSGQRGLLFWGVLTMCVATSYGAWAVPAAAARSLANDGIVVAVGPFARKVLFADIRSVRVAGSRGSMPDFLVITPHRAVLGRKLVLPIYDSRLEEVVVEGIAQWPQSHT
jgi:hypothetical protein